MGSLSACNVDVVGKRQLDERSRDKDVPVKIAIRFVWSSIDTDALLKRLVRHVMIHYPSHRTLMNTLPPVPLGGLPTNPFDRIVVVVPRRGF